MTPEEIAARVREERGKGSDRDAIYQTLKSAGASELQIAQALLAADEPPPVAAPAEIPQPAVTQSAVPARVPVPIEVSSTWTKTIPITNTIFRFIYIALVFGVCGAILVTTAVSSPSALALLVPFWAIMVAFFFLALQHFKYENKKFRELFSTSSAPLIDGLLFALILIRNLFFILLFIPGIQLIGLAFCIPFFIVHGIIYAILIHFRKKAILPSA